MLLHSSPYPPSLFILPPPWSRDRLAVLSSNKFPVGTLVTVSNISHQIQNKVKGTSWVFQWAHTMSQWEASLLLLRSLGTGKIWNMAGEEGEPCPTLESSVPGTLAVTTKVGQSWGTTPGSTPCNQCVHIPEHVVPSLRDVLIFHLSPIWIQSFACLSLSPLDQELTPWRKEHCIYL